MATRRRLIALGAGLAPGITLVACSGAARTSPAPSETRTRPAVAMEYWSRWPQPAPTEIEEKRVGEWNAANAPATFTRTGLVGDYIMLKKRLTYMGGTLLLASNKPRDADAAVDFILYLTAARHAEEINSVQNAVPPRRSARELPYVKDPLIKTFYDAVAYGWTYPNHAYYTEIRDVIVKEIDATMKLEKSVPAALDDAARGGQEYLDRR
jgi:ABC-type glycerol-3-phosphate transport system substrate-binding protein